MKEPDAIVISREELEGERQTLQQIATNMSNELAALTNRAEFLRSEIHRMEGQITRINIMLQKFNQPEVKESESP
jgi:uncharacterized protein involved in exopolysaccharide biosynthesis